MVFVYLKTKADSGKHSCRFGQVSAFQQLSCSLCYRWCFGYSSNNNWWFLFPSSPTSENSNAFSPRQDFFFFFSFQSLSIKANKQTDFLLSSEHRILYSEHLHSALVAGLSFFMLRETSQGLRWWFGGIALPSTNLQVI